MIRVAFTIKQKYLLLSAISVFAFILYQLFDPSCFNKNIQRISLRQSKDDAQKWKCESTIIDFSRNLSCRYFAFETDDANVIFLPFQQFLNTSTYSSCFSTRGKQNLALVVPTILYDEIWSSISIDAILAMIFILKSNDWLWVVGGKSIILNHGENPACTMKKENWTVELGEDYSRFQDSTDQTKLTASHCTRSINDQRLISKIDCHPCDLLPDIFLVKLSAIDRSIDLNPLTKYNESARLPLFLKLSGRSAYCPNIETLKQKNVKPSMKITCNDLRMPWDACFILIPQFEDIHRLILHQPNGKSIEHWLVCTWWRVASDLKLAVHCSNWMRQFLFDLIDVVDDQLHLEYRLAYGTLLGAIRINDVIPWSADSDAALYAEEKEFRYKIWPRINEFSRWRYSHEDRTGDVQYAPVDVRAFSRCPMRLTSLRNQSINDVDRTLALEKTIRAGQKLDAMFSYGINSTYPNYNWRCAGYLDFFWADNNPEICINTALRSKDYELVEIAGRRFKTFINPVRSIECTYGKNWATPPASASGEWRWFID